MKSTIRAKRRHKRVSVIRRKAALWREIYGWPHPKKGMLAKGKIHCSCYLCTGKTKFCGLSHADLKASERYYAQLKELSYEE